MQSVHGPSVYRTVPSTQYKPQQGCSAHHIIWMLLNTFYMFKVELIFFPGGSGGSTTAQWCGLLSSSNQGFQVTPQIGSSCMVVTAWWWIVLPIHIMWIVSLTIVMFEMDVGTMQYVSAAWINGQWYGKMPRIIPGFQLHSQILVIKCSGKGMAMYPSVHPHHINFVKQHFYVICAFSNYSRWVYIINHCTMAW
jgi:hypothetical protein